MGDFQIVIVDVSPCIGLQKTCSGCVIGNLVERLFISCGSGIRSSAGVFSGIRICLAFGTSGNVVTSPHKIIETFKENQIFIRRGDVFYVKGHHLVVHVRYSYVQPLGILSRNNGDVEMTLFVRQIDVIAVIGAIQDNVWHTSRQR